LLVRNRKILCQIGRNDGGGWQQEGPNYSENEFFPINRYCYLAFCIQHFPGEQLKRFKELKKYGNCGGMFWVHKSGQ